MRATLIAGLLTTTLPLAPAAMAQETQDAPALEEIVVTAQKREQAVQDIGLSISVVTPQALADAGVSGLNGLETVTSGLEIESQFGGGQPAFAIRGVGFRDYATNNTPTVGIYVDGVAYPFPTMTQGVLFDLARVEVLRGPQGTLYGRNTTAGAVSIVTNRPTDRFEAGLTLEASSYEAISAEGFVSGPLGGGARARLAAITEQGGAWQRNRETGAALGERDRFAVRGQLDLTLSEATGLLLAADIHADRSDGLGLRLFRPVTLGTVRPVHTGRDTSWGSSAGFAAANGIAVDTAPFRDNEGFGLSATLDHDFGPAALTAILAHGQLDRREFNDWDGVPEGVAGVLFDSEIEVSSAELRLVSASTVPFGWIVGTYVSQEDLREVYNSDFGASFGPAFQAVRTPYSQRARTFSVFGQVDWAVSDATSLIAGARWETEDRDLSDLGTFANGFGTFNFANGRTDGVLESRSTGFDEWSGRLAVEHRPTDGLLLFASVARGIKSGGFTAYNTLNPRGIDPFAPEELVAWESGIKWDAGTRLRLNAAAFVYDYRNQQVQSAIFDPALQAVVGRIVNAPESRVAGVEAELWWLPLDGLTIEQSLTWQQGEFETFADLDIAATTAAGAARFTDRSGQALGFPELSYRGAASFEWAILADLQARAALDWSWRDQTSLPLLGPSYAVPAYWLTNASLSVSPTDATWSVGLFARNLLDEEYATTRNFFAGFDLTPVEAPGAPRTVGVRLSVRR
jgi:outer membrane receptor protein involved in Fe transport